MAASAPDPSCDYDLILQIIRQTPVSKEVLGKLKVKFNVPVRVAESLVTLGDLLAWLEESQVLDLDVEPEETVETLGVLADYLGLSDDLKARIRALHVPPEPKPGPRVIHVPEEIIKILWSDIQDQGWVRPNMFLQELGRDCPEIGLSEAEIDDLGGGDLWMAGLDAMAVRNASLDNRFDLLQIIIALLKKDRFHIPFKKTAGKIEQAKREMESRSKFNM